jgi:hypothetical protein
MNTDRLPLFVGLAKQWWTVAGYLRARGVPEGDPILGIWREAAWCHLMFDRGLASVALSRLRVVVRNVTGTLPLDTDKAATDLFDQLRDVVSARYPGVFPFSVAA